jgi:hypothetical protein
MMEGTYRRLSQVAPAGAKSMIKGPDPDQNRSGCGFNNLSFDGRLCVGDAHKAFLDSCPIFKLLGSREASRTRFGTGAGGRIYPAKERVGHYRGQQPVRSTETQVAGFGVDRVL